MSDGSKFVVGQWVECVDDSDQCNLRHGLKKGEFYRVSRLRERFDEIYIDGLGQSLFQHRFRPVEWQIGKTYKTTLEGVTATIWKVEGGVVWNRTPGWRHATEPIGNVTYHETTGKLRYCEDRGDVPHLTPYLADEPEPSSDKPTPVEADPINPPSRYHRTIRGVTLDLYDIAEAYGLDSHRIFHAVKKLVMAGRRGHKDREQDLREAIVSIESELRKMKGGVT